MSSVETKGNGAPRRGFRLLRSLAFAFLSAPIFAACGSSGLHPLYGPTLSGAGLDQRLAHVEVAAIPGRVGQRIRNELIFQNTGGGSPLPPTHRFEVEVRETLLSTLVKIDGQSFGQIYQIDASYRLIDLRDKKVVFQGRSTARAGFERFQSIYSNVRAREDAENRAASTVAGEIKTRLAAYLSGAA
jgi:LPS-assembly lipoprotein